MKNAQEKYLKSRKAEVLYGKKLRSIAKQVDHLVKGLAPNGIFKKKADQEQLIKLLKEYSEFIKPWARSVAITMLQDINRRDLDMWHRAGNEAGRHLKKEIETAPLGLAMAQGLEEQVKLITSLPLEAAQRVHDLTMLGLSDSTRAKDVAKEILNTGHVTKGRANTIARTEVARTATELTKVRAQHAGITHYIWRTSGDSDVRKSHREMNGRVIAFNEEPTLSDGTRCHAGGIYNCRCYPEPIIPEEY